MRIRIEAIEGELEHKSLELMKNLLQRLVEEDPRLSKALDVLEDENEPPIASTPVMQGLVTRAVEVYSEELNALIDDVVRELET